MIKIGVSSCLFYPDPERIVFGHKTLCYIEKDMAGYLTRKDVIPILIPDLAESSMNTFLNSMDGFVFQGGTDVAPSSYHEEPILDGRWPGDPQRDEYELRVMDYAIHSGKPVLGICRGLQLMNVFFGGTLYQDIVTQKKDALVHRDADRYDQLSHGIDLVPDKLLDEIYKKDLVRRVNSVHHQGIKDVGNDLEVLAVCPDDGIVEAVQWTEADPGKVMGVQWHPEFFYNFEGALMNPHKVYDHFLSFCR